MEDASRPITTNFINVHPPENFDLHASEAAERWEDWKLEFDAYADIVQLEKQPQLVQKGTFLRALGIVGHKTYKTFVFEEGENKDDLKIIIKKFDDRFAPERNETYETYMFRNRMQKKGETFDEWLSDLRIKAQTCNFGEALERNLRDQIIFGVSDEVTRQTMLRKKTPSLNDIIGIGRKAQATETYKTAFNAEKTVAVIHKRSHTPHSYTPHTPVRYGKSPQHLQPRQDRRTCGNCGHNHDWGKCPAYGAKCNHCGKLNHYANLCRSKKKWSNGKVNKRNVNEVTEEQTAMSTLRISALEVHSAQVKNKPWLHQIKTLHGVFSAKLDTGADCNVMSESTAKRLKLRIRKTTPVTLEAYGGEKITPVGEVSVIYKEKQPNRLLKFLIIKKQAISILGRDSCIELSLIQRVHAVGKESTPEEIIGMYEDCFTGYGNFGKPHHIQLEEHAVPVNRPGRPVPTTLYPKVKQELARMESLGIIKRVTVPTAWCSEMTCILKPDGSVRVCIDPIDLKKVIKRPRYPMTSLEDLAARMPGAKYFTVIDANAAFWQIPVDRESSELLTFNTPFGRYQYLRLPMGTPDAPEVFQQRASEFAEDLEGVEVTVDDFLIWGTTLSEHNHRLCELLKKSREKGLKLKKEKLQLAQTQVKYCGHIFSASGLKPDPTKIEAITHYKQPENKGDVQRFLGMVAYLQKFIPRASELTAPLRQLVLVENDTTFAWTPAVNEAFEKLKESLSTAPVLSLFDVNKESILSVDASSHGVGAVLLQDSKPVAYASRALTPTQKNYAQIEKELLAVVFGTERFKKYIFGKKTLVETDHKPLEMIFAKTLSSAPARLQRMLLQLQRYDLDVKYVPGTQLHIADALSRAHLDESEELHQNMQICMISTVSDERWQQLKVETTQDTELSQLRDIVQTGWPQIRNQVPIPLGKYWSMRDELVIQNSVIMKGNRIVVPKSMQSEMLKLIHEGHLGAELCKRRAREVLYWYGMNSEIDQLVRCCIPCQKQRPNNPKEPMIVQEIPKQPYLKVASDMFELQGRHYALIVDYTSGHIDVETLKNGTSAELIQFCKRTFRSFGIPACFVSDNGTPYTSRQFRDFSEDWGFKLITSSPEYPQSNGLAENAVKTIKKIMAASRQTKDDFDLALLNLNNSPRGNKLSPNQILMRRRLRSRLPDIENSHHEGNEGTLRTPESRVKSKMNYDKATKELSQLHPGEEVYMRTRKNEWKEAKVVKKLTEPRSYLIEVEGKNLRRNRKQLIQRHVSATCNASIYPIDDSDEEQETPKWTDNQPSSLPTDVQSSATQPTRSVQENPPTQERQPSSSETQPVRKSNRGRKHPDYLQDYVTE